MSLTQPMPAPSDDPVRNACWRWPVWRTLLMGILIVLGLAALIEATARIENLQSHLPPESVGCGHPQLDRKLVLLRTMVKKAKAIDCIFIGSSFVYRGFNPDPFEVSFQQVTQKPIRSFNFGLVGLLEEGQEVLMKILVDKYHPRLVLIGVSPASLDEDIRTDFTRQFVDNPWALYYLGHFSLDGWLIDRSAAFRHYLGYRFQSMPLSREARISLRKAIIGMTPKGYGYRGVMKFNELISPRRKALENYQISAAYLDSLRRMMLLRSQVSIVVVEMPIHPSVLSAFGGGEKDYQRGLDVVDQLVTQRGGRFCRLTPSCVIPADGWQDAIHMNCLGAEALSNWLGEWVGQAVHRGELDDPSAGSVSGEGNQP